MMKDEDDTRRFSLEELKEQRERAETETRADAPVYPVDAEFWASARVVVPSSRKASVHLRLDSDVLEWFKAQGRGHLTHMNAVLRSYMEARKGQPR